MGPHGELFNEPRARHALTEAGKRVGIPTNGAELMRLGENALFHVPFRSTSLVARVARTMDYWADVEKEVAVASWLAAYDFPGAQLADVAPQPVAGAGHPVTFWAWIEGTAAGLDDAGTLGRLLQRLHNLAPPPQGLPQLDPFERVEGRIATASIDSGDKRFLSGLCGRLREEWDELDFTLPPGPVHGDAHVKNLMLARDGQPILIDFERFAWGQPEWDLAKTATECHTAGFFTRDQYQAFAEGYGFDITAWAGFATLQRTTALNMVTWLMQNAADDKWVAREFAKRMRTLRGEESLAWSAH